MGHYLVTHSCGHQQYRMVRDWNSDYRDKRLAFETSRRCSTCWKLEQDALRTDHAKLANALNQANSLPPLTGTPQQIAWAEIIRSSFLTDLPLIAESLKDSRYLRQKRFASLTHADLDRLIAQCISDCMTNPSASFFIDVRNKLETHFKTILYRRIRQTAAFPHKRGEGRGNSQPDTCK